MKEFKYRITEEDYVSSQKENSKNRRFISFLVTGVTGCFVFLLIAGFESSTVVILPIIFVLSYLIYFLITPLFNIYSFKKSFKKYLHLQKEHSIFISEFEIKFQSENGFAKYKRDDFLKIKETKILLMFYIGPKLFYIVPKRFVEENAIMLIREKYM